MITHGKLSERLQVSDAADWVPVALYRDLMAVGVMVDADATEGVTIQMRKATSAAGANAANHGTAVTTLSTATNSTVVAQQDAKAVDLGKTGSTEYTHVSATVTKAGSPTPAETVYGFLVRAGGRFNP